jgi:hypothetical protein
VLRVSAHRLAHVFAGLVVAWLVCVATEAVIATDATAGQNESIAVPISLRTATSPFSRSGFVLVSDLAMRLPQGIAENYGINAKGAPGLGGLIVYVNPYWARRALRSSTVFWSQYTYRVANVVLTIDPFARRTKRQKLLAALRTLGRPTRLG